MYCYTLTLGGVPERGIRIAMTPKHPTPAVVVGREDGPTIPIDSDWFNRIIDLQVSARGLPECHKKQLSLPILHNCDLVGGEIVDGNTAPYQLMGRSRDDTDKRALVHLKPPREGRISYTGCHRIETMDEAHRVVARFPKLEDVVGIEVIALDSGSALIVMHPGSGFRVVHPFWDGGPNVHMYKLPASIKPKIIDVTRRENKAA